MVVLDKPLSLRIRSPATCKSALNGLAIVAIIYKPNFHFASYHQRSQRLPTIVTITITGIESESISAVVNDCQRSQQFNGNHQFSDCSNRNDCKDPSDHMEIIGQRSQRSCVSYWRVL